MRRSGGRGSLVERAGLRPIEQEETHDLFRLGGNRIRNQPGDPADILVAVVGHAEPHHHQPRRGHNHDVLALGAARHERIGRHAEPDALGSTARGAAIGPEAGA